MGLLSGTVFDRPPHCERCDRLESECRCLPEATKTNVVAPERQTARLSLEKRRKGKLVTVIRGLAASDNDLPALLTQLKSFCGAGGTIDADSLEIQGDQCDRLRLKLKQIGYQVR